MHDNTSNLKTSQTTDCEMLANGPSPFQVNIRIRNIHYHSGKRLPHSVKWQSLCNRISKSEPYLTNNARFPCVIVNNALKRFVVPGKEKNTIEFDQSTVYADNILI